jgi:outer membrane protein OmpA-like peptidoglycan-associated protein
MEFMNRLSALAIVVLFLGQGVAAEEFRFQYAEGTRYRILSQVDEKVYVNGLYSHTADILNKITIEVGDVAASSGYLKAQFQTFERSQDSDSVYEWSREYTSEFWRDEFGAYDIEARYFMPVVRDVPRFPDREIESGDTWSAIGEEVHDLRDNFGIPDAFHFPIQVGYRYLGEEDLAGDVYDLISIDYTVFYRSIREYDADMFPVKVSGYSHQLLYWDRSAGRPHHYSEEFDFIFDFNTGDSVEYVGVAEATVHDAEEMDREQVAEEIRDQLEGANVENADVRVSEDGVTVSIENIQFLPDSSILVAAEAEKLELIGEILAAYPQRDILITGHTALAGTAPGRQALSEERARAVGNYLLSLGVRTEDQIATRGMGGREPIADNSTEESMRRNRRVEITILEN